MKAVIYARVSSNNQDIENSIQAQTRACKEFADSKQYEISEIYTDKAESGKISQRPEFQRMIADAKKKQFSIILVHKFDRFSRNREDAVTYKALLRKCKVDLISVTEPVGDDLYGKLIEGILEVTSEFYSLNLGQETRKGQLQVFERGFHPNGLPPFGYKGKRIKIGDEFHTVLEPDPETAPIVKKIFEMASSGYFLKDILNYLNQSQFKPIYTDIWGYPSLYRILKNKKYIGECSYDSKTENVIVKKIFTRH